MKGAISLVLATAGVMAGFYFLPQLLTLFLKSEQPAAVVVSRSMWPVLNRGDVVFIKGTTLEEIQVGTVLIFKHGNGIAIHRVVRLSGHILVTKGDANSNEDEPIVYDDVVGRLPQLGRRYAKIPWVGRLPLMMGPQGSYALPGETPASAPGMFGALAGLIHNPLGLVVLVIIPSGLVLTALAMEVIPRVGPGRRQRRWRQRRLQRLGKWGTRSRLAHR